jgi:D-sedoheptulose 7-phosphate isomerase
MNKSVFAQNIFEHLEVVKMLNSVDRTVVTVGEIAGKCLLSGGKILFCGNGGSAADSQHLAAELTGRFVTARRPFAALALSSDSSSLTCISNDYSFSEVFARQVIALGRKGDLLIGISTSGNSENVLRAIEEASRMGINTVGMTGGDGGRLTSICDYGIIVPSTSTARIQECHILIGHTICQIIEKTMEKK